MRYYTVLRRTLLWQVLVGPESSDGDRWDGLASRGDDGGERERSILGIDRIVQRRSHLH